jgi:hypothetical protein
MKSDRQIRNWREIISIKIKVAGAVLYIFSYNLREIFLLPQSSDVNSDPDEKWLQAEALIAKSKTGARRAISLADWFPYMHLN